MRGWSVFGVGTVVSVALLVRCLDPTEVDVVLTTDLDCAQFGEAKIIVGTLGSLDTTTESATVDVCTGGGSQQSLGDIVLTPSGNSQGTFALEVVAAQKGTMLAGCSPSTPAGCIFARRALRYLPHTPLRLPIALDSACLGKPCTFDETCVDGVCKDATIADPSRCHDNGCDQGTLGGPDGGSTTDGGLTAMNGALAVGDTVACATGVNGTECWGFASFGEFGDGTLIQSRDTADAGPRTFKPGEAAWLAAQNQHACAVLASPSGAVRCWGKNDLEQVAPSDAGTIFVSPVPVGSLPADVVEVTTGQAHSCAVTKSGDLYCWGSNQYGEIGTTGSSVSVAVPYRVSALPAGSVAHASAGFFVTCAITTGGDVYCWGIGAYGELGSVSKDTPQPVKILSGATAVSVGGHEHVCALMAGTGGVKCWGTDSAGQLGLGNFDGGTATHLPTDVLDLAGATAISAGGYHTCALLPGGAVKCWGRFVGAIDLGLHPTPTVAIDGVTARAVAIAAGGVSRTCALMDTGGVKCWGNSYLGNGTTIGSVTPVDVVGFP